MISLNRVPSKSVYESLAPSVGELGEREMLKDNELMSVELI